MRYYEMSCEQLIDTLLKTCEVKCKNCGESQTHYTELLSHLKKCHQVSLTYTAEQELAAEKTKSWLLSKIIESNLKINLQQVVTEPETSKPVEKKDARKRLKKVVKPEKTESYTDDEKISKKLEEIKRKKEVEFTYKKQELLDKIKSLAGETTLSPELPLLRLHLLYHYGIERWEKMVKAHHARMVKMGESSAYSQHFSCIEQRLLNKVSQSSSAVIEEELRNFEKALYLYHKKNTDSFRPAFFLDWRVFLLPIKVMFGSYFLYVREHFMWTPSEDQMMFYVKTGAEWNLDWSLEITMMNLYQDLTVYLNSLFRSKYNTVFGDNFYREDFLKFFKETDDVKQLLANVFYVSDYDRVEKDFQEMVRRNCAGTLESTPMGVVPKKVKKIEYSQREVLEKLFDSIGEKEIKEFKKMLEELSA